MDTGLGQSKKVVSFPRGLGRQFDGGYQEYALVPGSTVIPFQSELPWEVLGAVPEMYQTANGLWCTASNWRPERPC